MRTKRLVLSILSAIIFLSFLSVTSFAADKSIRREYISKANIDGVEKEQKVVLGCSDIEVMEKSVMIIEIRNREGKLINELNMSLNMENTYVDEHYNLPASDLEGAYVCISFLSRDGEYIAGPIKIGF